MISLDECKKHIPYTRLPDKKIEELRDSLTLLIEKVVVHFMHARIGANSDQAQIPPVNADEFTPKKVNKGKQNAYPRKSVQEKIIKNININT